MAKRLRKHKRRKLSRYICPQIANSRLLDYPKELWPSFEARALDLGISLADFLRREAVIDMVIAQQLASLNPAIAAQGGNTGKPGPQRIERIFSNLKR